MNDDDQYEPTQEDIDFLNETEGLVGSKPYVQHIKEEPLTFPAWQLEIEDGDHLRDDEQPFDEQ